jgi:hypothetical protein
VPILFGILRKELSLLMVYQALGTLEIDRLLDWVQILVFLVFLTFYIPCVSTFAVMLKRSAGARPGLRWRCRWASHFCLRGRCAWASADCRYWPLDAQPIRAGAVERVFRAARG